MSAPPTTINLATRVPVTGAEGPGKRFALWVQGCPLRCPGCCNPHFLEFKEAERISVGALYAEVAAVADEIEGVTLLGGEPFSQSAALAELCSLLRRDGLSVMAFTGALLEDLSAPDEQDLLAEVDLLVDGPYLREQHCTDRRWIGSANQRVHFLSDRYRHLDIGGELGGNTLEIRLKDGALTINGFPHPDVSRIGNRLARR